MEVQAHCSESPQENNSGADTSEQLWAAWEPA